MCQFASFFFRCEPWAVRVADLNSHGNTQEGLGLRDTPRPDGWREGHWLPAGELVCRVLEGDSLTAAEARNAMLAQWPTFVAFLMWAVGQPEYVPNSLDLHGCDLKGVTLPKNLRDKVRH